MPGDKQNFRPRIVVMYCANALAKGADPSALKTNGHFTLKTAAIACSSKAELSHLMKLLADGADAVQLVACPEGDCRFLDGSSRAEKRVARGRALLGQIGMGEERLGIARGGGLDLEALKKLLKERAELVRGLGRNPVSREEKE